MNNKVLALIVCLFVGLTAYQVRIKTSYNNSNEVSDMVLLNINALTGLENPETGSGSGSGSGSGGNLSGNGESLSGNGESGNGSSAYTREECLRKGGNWNMASVCVDGKAECFKCEVSGEISVLGITLKGSYTKGNTYIISWARYSCQTSEGNCCTRQGVEVNKH